MSNNNASEGVAGKVDLKFIMEALTSEVKRIFRAELEQFHERVEQSFNVTPQISGGLFFFFSQVTFNKIFNSLIHTYSHVTQLLSNDT